MKYVKKVAPTEEEVTKILNEGFTLSAITPRIEETKSAGYVVRLTTSDVYHFIKKDKEESK
jgi:hypothetical protein